MVIFVDGSVRISSITVQMYIVKECNNSAFKWDTGTTKQ